jgi:hypothetical protein
MNEIYIFVNMNNAQFGNINVLRLSPLKTIRSYEWTAVSGIETMWPLSFAIIGN